MDVGPTFRFAIASVVVALVGGGLARRACRADLVYFRKGGAAQLPAKIDGQHVVLTIPDANVSLARDQITMLVPGFWPASEWARRREKARELGVEARFAAVW